MLDILVCKALTIWALRQSHTFTKGTIIGLAVDCV